MAKLTIEGDKSQLIKLSKQVSGRVKKYGLNISLDDNKKGGGNSLPLDNEPKLTDAQIAELISKCESLEELQQYEGDLKQVSSKAYKKKLKELE